MYKPEQIKNSYLSDIKNKLRTFYISSSSKILNKKIISTLLSVILFILSVFLPVIAEEINSGYAKNEILFLKWGNGENEVGLEEKEITVPIHTKETKMTVRNLPNQLAVDGKGNVYINDIVQKKAVKLNPQTKSIEKFESNKGHLEILADEEDEGLYILNRDDKSVDFIGADKIRENKKLDEKTFENVLKRKAVIRNKKIIDRSEKKVLARIANKQDDQIEANQVIDPSVIKYTKLDPYTYKFQNLSKVGASCDEKIFKANFQLAKIDFLQIDNKNIYYLFDKIPDVEQEFYEYFVVKLNLITCDIEFIFLEKDLFHNFGAVPGLMVKIDKEGNIYQLLPKKDGIHIVKWSK